MDISRMLSAIESTSTTWTTALPSNTRRTFSASRFFLEDAEDEEPPENASQKAEPNLLIKVWLASATTISSLCACSASFWISFLAEEEKDGGEDDGAELYVEDPPRALDLPGNRPANGLGTVCGNVGEEEDVGSLGDEVWEKKCGRMFAARPVGWY